MICHHTMLKNTFISVVNEKQMYFCSERKKLLKSFFVHASIYPVLVTNKNCYLILQSCNYKKPFIHPSLVFVLLHFFVGGGVAFKMEFCNNLTPLRQEKTRRMWFNREKWTKALELQMHDKVSSHCQQTFTVTKWQPQSWFHEQLTLFISAINSKKKTTGADISSANNNSAKCLFFSTFR